ncbi:MAG: enoyl-CoA hydratase/isomerase family protein [Dehalococcoidia bacterium]
MEYETIILKKEGHIARLTLNRPARLNAITMQLIAEAQDAIKDVEADDNMRVLIVTGAGRAFCAGGDFRGDPNTPGAIAVDTDPSPAKYAQWVRSYTRGIPLALQNLHCPTIAMINGVATGAGFSITQACDIRIGVESARFSVAWTTRGLVPAFGDTWLLPRIVGTGRAAELILTARFMDAKEASDIGFLNKLVPADKLEEETMALAEQIVKGPPLALRLSKFNLYKGFEVDFDSALGLLAHTQSELFVSDDFKESTRAFQEKRQPVFKGH